MHVSNISPLVDAKIRKYKKSVYFDTANIMVKIFFLLSSLNPTIEIHTLIIYEISRNKLYLHCTRVHCVDCITCDDINFIITISWAFGRYR